MKKLYHGSTAYFDVIDINAGKGYKDFGSMHDYDIVIGPTADAETTMIINDYIDELEKSGYSDEVCETVIALLKPENLPKQYFFGTEKALQTLKFDKIIRQVIG